MRNVNSLARLGERDFQALGKSVTGMAAEVGQKPKLLAAGLYDIVSSGFKANDAVKILRVSAIAATAGLTDTATSAKAVTAALNAYHLGADDARKVSDVLFQTVNKGVLTFEELSQQMGDLVPAAAPLGVSLEEIGAGMATLTLQGVPAAEAATRMKSSFIQLAKPGTAMKALLKEIGFNSGEAAIKGLGYSGVLQAISDKTKGSVSETAKLTPEIRALLGVVGLTGKNLKVYLENLQAMKDAQQGAGVTAQVFAEQGKSFAVQWQKAAAALDVFKIQVGNALLPALSSGLGAVSNFLSKMNEAQGFKAKISVAFDVAKDAFTAVRQSIETMLFGGASGAVTGMGGTTVTIDPGMVAKVRDAFAKVNWTSVGQAVIEGITNALKKAGDLAKALAGTISDAIDKVNWNDVGRKLGPGFATMMLSAVAAILDPAFWAKNWDLLLAILLAVFGRGLGRLAAPLGRLLAKPFGDAVLLVGKQLERFSPRLAKAVVDGLVALPGLVKAAFKGLQAIIGAALKPLEAIVRAVFGRLAGLAIFTIKVLGIDIAINAIADFATGPAWDAIQTAFTTVETVATTTWAAIAAGVTTFGSTIAGAMTAAWEAVRTAMTVVLTTLEGAATTAWNAITAGVSTFGSGLVSAMTTAWNAVRTATTTVLTTITGAVTTAFTTMQSGVTSGMTAIGTAATTGWNAVSTATTTALTPIAAAVTTAFASMRTGVTTGMTAIAGAMTTAWTEIKGAAVAAWNAVVGTITNAVGTATTAATAVGRGIVNGIGQGLTTIFAVVKGGLDKIWGIISNVASLAFNAAKAIGAQIVQGILSGLGDIAGKVGGALKSGAEKALHAIDPRNLKPWSPVSHWAVMLAEELTKEVSSVERILGSSLTKALTAALRGATDKAGDVAVKGMNNVGKLIVAAAKKYGVDARAALAVAMGEGGIKFGAVGDSGHAFGPFQFNNAGGVATGKSAAEASAWANSARGVADAIRMMADAGARGKTGLDAITAIVRNFERPLDPSASIAKAAAAYKTLGPQIASAVTSGTTAVAGATRGQITAIANLVRQYAPIIGLTQARGVIAGLVQGQPTLLQQAKAGMLAVIAAQKQAVTDAKGAFASAFNGLANAALQAFDTRWAAWVPPAQRLLDKMQIAEQVKQVQDQLATAMTAISGGGAFDASVLSKQLGDSLATAMSQALGSIAGAKTEEALNRVAAQVQTQVLAAIDQTAATATTQAQAAVDAARTALTAAQAGGDPEAIAAAQAALDTAVGNQRALEAAILAEKELALGQLVAAEQRRHDAIGVTQREGLAKQLEELKGFMTKHPEEWGKMGAAVQAILADYNVKLTTAGKAWATKFGDGVHDGIPYAVARARELAAAVAAVLPSTGSPLKPAKTGPLSFHPRTMGKAWATNFASGLSSGNMGNIVGALVSGAPMPVAAGVAAAGAGGGATTINVYVTGSVTTEQELSEAIYRNLERRGRRNVSIFNR